MVVSYEWLKEYLGSDAPSAEEIAELLTFHSFEIEEVKKVGNDVAIDVDVLPNRSSDCLSHRGIAREIATLTNVPLFHDPLNEPPQLKSTDVISIEIEDKEACPRFTASLISGITVKESPDWLKQHLETLGQRPINNIVDATNYVMYAIGQPIHAYDAERFPQSEGKWQFGVRRSKEGEVVSLLSESGGDEERNITLDGSELLIVDNSSNTPIGLAGVKGGRFAGVGEKTTKVIIEAAHFHPTLTRKTARKHGIVIDASKRFENEPSRALPLYAQKEIIDLITKIAGGEHEGTTDVYLDEVTNPSVSIRKEKANALLGLTLETEEMESILSRAGITVARSGDVMECVGPFERTDLTIEEDFIEEIGRIYGYEHVLSAVPEKIALKEINKRHYYSEAVRRELLSLGFSEVITSSFRKKDTIKLRNALASDKAYMRSSLIKNISEVLDKNAGLADLLGTPDTRVFEIGTVFEKTGKTVGEHFSLAIGVRIRPNGYSGREDKVLGEAVTELGVRLGTTLAPNIEKGIAEIDLSALVEELPEPEAYEQVEVGEEIVYTPFSQYPFISRDIALWAPKTVTSGEVTKLLNEHAGSLRVRTTLFDEFNKEDRISYAFRLVFQSMERTLTDGEIGTVMKTVEKACIDAGFEVR